MSNKIVAKKAAVVELVKLQGKNVRDQIPSVAKKYGLTTKTLDHAWENFTNWGKVDLRYKRCNAVKATGLVVKFTPAQKAKYSVKAKTASKIVTPQLSALQWRQHVREWLFGSMRTSTFCIKKGINLQDFYGVLRELSISGTVKGYLVLDYRKYGKINMKKVFTYCRAKARNCSNKYIESLSVMKGTSANEMLLISRVRNVLAAYLA